MYRTSETHVSNFEKRISPQSPPPRRLVFVPTKILVFMDDPLLLAGLFHFAVPWPALLWISPLVLVAVVISVVCGKWKTKKQGAEKQRFE